MLLLERRQADHHRDAEAEEGHHAAGADPKGERQRRDRVRSLEPDGVDALADDQRPRSHARRRGDGAGSFVHGGIVDRGRPGRQPGVYSIGRSPSASTSSSTPVWMSKRKP